MQGGPGTGMTPEELERRVAESRDRLREHRRQEFATSVRAASSCPNIEAGLYRVACRLPDEVFDELDELGLLVLFAGANEPHSLHFAEPIHVTQDDVDRVLVWEEDVWLVVLVAELEDAPQVEIVGTVAHELAHVVLGHDGLNNPDSAEFDACALAIRWGFVQETLHVLRKTSENRLEGTTSPLWEYCVGRMGELEALAAECDQGSGGE